jgi:signal transduction histidine kinase
MNIGNKLIIDIDVDEMPAMLSNKLQLTFYRVIQERLNNIVKYAKAAHVKITIKIDGHNIALAVADDGQGFDINQKKEGIGLENIRRRAGLFDGKTKIESSPGRGCRIAIEIPCLIAEDY